MSERAPDGTTRRGFAKTVATLALASPFVPLHEAVGAAVAPAHAARPARPAAGAGDETPEAEALMRVLRHRYGMHLSPEQQEAVQRGVEGTLRSAERLHAVRLRNADEPTFVFAAWRGES